MKKEQEENFIRALAIEIIGGVGLKEWSDSSYEKLVESLEQRITSRVFLEVISMLTPEQAEKVKGDIDSGGNDPQSLILKISQEIPDFQLRIAEVLSRIKMELVDDLGILR